MNPLAIKVTICAILALGVFLGGYKAGSLAGDAEVSALKEKVAQEREQAAVKLSQEVLANELLKSKLAKQTQDNLAIIAAHPAPSGVHLPAGLCADYGQADATGSGESSGQTSGTLFEGIEGILSADRSRAAGIVTEAEVELTNCREVKEWAKGLRQ